MCGMNRRFIVLALAAALGLLRASVCRAADYFVRMDGSNGNTGTSPGAAWATVAHAAQRVGAGDTVYIGAGTYAGQIYLTNRGGTAESPVRFVGDTQGLMTGDAGEVILTNNGLAHVQRSSHTHFIGLRLVSTGNTLVYNDNSQGVLLQDCVLEGAGSALSSQNAGSFVVRDCTISAAGNHGVYLSQGSLEMSGTTVTAVGTQYSAVHATNGATVVIDRSSLLDGGHVLYFSGATVTLTNTVVANARLSGVHAVNQTRMTAVHCTFDSIANDAMYLDGGQHTIHNTIFHDAGRYMIFRANNASITELHCLYDGWGTQLGSNFTPTDPVLADPMFADASASDYTLADGSPALDAGMDASGFTVEDRDGSGRPDGAGWDIGAYEAGGATTAVSVRTPYESAFDAVGPEWVVPATGTTGLIGGFLGPMGRQQSGEDAAVLHLVTTPGTTYRVAFSLILFDRWDFTGVWQDAIRVRANDALIAEYVPRSGDVDLDAQLNGRSRSDRVFRVVTARFTATSERTRLSFTGVMTGEFPEEGWGIDNLSVAELSPADTPYETDFGSSPGPEWLSDAIDDTNATTGPFLGRFGSGNANGTMLSVRTEPGQSYDLRFDAYFIDSWDSPEDLRVFIGATPVIANALGNGYARLSRTYGGRTADPSEFATHIGFADRWPETLIRGVRVRFEATEEITDIVFRASTNQSIDDESWGLDNVSVGPAANARVVRWREVSPVDVD